MEPSHTNEIVESRVFFIALINQTNLIDIPNNVRYPL